MSRAWSTQELHEDLVHVTGPCVPRVLSDTSLTAAAAHGVTAGSTFVDLGNCFGNGAGVVRRDDHTATRRSDYVRLAREITDYDGHSAGHALENFERIEACLGSVLEVALNA